MTFTERLKELMGRARPAPATIHMTRGGRNFVRFANYEQTTEQWLTYLPYDERELYLALRNHAESLLKLVELADLATKLQSPDAITVAITKLRAALSELDGAGR